MDGNSENLSENSPKTIVKELEDSFYRQMKILQDPITFKVYLLLLTYNELSLVELTQKVGKSKPTVFRHVQKLIEADFVTESREEKVRGSILAKFYRPKMDNFAPKNPFMPDQLQSLSNEDRIRFYREICRATGVSINFIKSALDELQIYLDQKPVEEIPDFIMAPDIILNLQFLPEKAYNKWFEGYQKFMMEFFQSMQAEILNPDIERPYALILGVLPVKKIYNRQRNNPPEDEGEGE